METLSKSDVGRGRMLYWVLGLSNFGAGIGVLVMLLLYAEGGADRLFWLRLAGLALGLAGAARGSVPVRYLLVLMVALGFAVGMGAASASGWHWLMTALGVLDLLTGLALGYMVMMDGRVNAFFVAQRWRYFGERVRVEGDSAAQDSATKGGKDAGRMDLPKDLDLFE